MCSTYVSNKPAIKHACTAQQAQQTSKHSKHSKQAQQASTASKQASASSQAQAGKQASKQASAANKQANTASKNLGVARVVLFCLVALDSDRFAMRLRVHIDFVTKGTNYDLSCILLF